MPLQKYIKALRRNVSQSIVEFQTTGNIKTSDLIVKIEKFIEKNNIKAKITNSDLSRCKNTTGGKNSDGAIISPEKLFLLERFLKDNKCWKQAVQSVQTRQERYYSNIAEMLTKNEKHDEDIIEKFDALRRGVERGSEPEIVGCYTVIRKSMHSLGDFNKSVISFFKNEIDEDIYEFKEKRIIAKKSGLTYTITYSGFMNNIRNTYILNGLSYIEGSGYKSYTPFPEMMYIHNDRDTNRLVGIWTSSTTENGHPCSSPVIMRAVSEEVYNKTELGVILNTNEIDNVDLEHFERALNQEYGMLYIDGNII